MAEVELEFEKIHTEFRSRIQRYLTRLVGEDEAEDLTQEVFVRVSRALHTFRGESKLSTWIYRIATNAALDRLRSPSFKREAQDEVTDGSDLDDIDVEGQQVGAGEEMPSLEERIFRKERLECYERFIENLPAKYRAVVALKELEGLAVGEIAEILGLSADVVKIRLHRGRARLLQELKAHCNPQDWL